MIYNFFSFFLDFILVMAFLKEISKGEFELKETVTKVTNRKGEVFEETKHGIHRVGVTEHPDYFNRDTEITKYEPSYFVDGKWIEINYESSHTKPKFDQNLNNSISCITYNVWFDEKAKEERAQALLDIVLSKNPDIICFQEVTASFLKIILENDEIRKQYCCSDTSLYRSITPYGVVMLCKLNVNVNYFNLVSLPSNMGRRALIMKGMINSKPITIATAHLESMNNPELRHIQLVDNIYPLLPLDEYSIFMGDSNFCNSSDEYENNISKPGILHDVWSNLYPQSSLEDSKTMVDELLAIDRILFTPKTIHPESIEKLGFEKTVNFGNSEFISPSDHVGLFSVLKFS